MSNIAIKFENISKQYRLGTIGTGTLSHDLKRWWTVNIRGKEDPYIKIGQENILSSHRIPNTEHRIPDFVWALKDIDLEVKQGEVLGIIGKNGAGKSTLLKILSRVTTPTTGIIKARGRIASLLEVGTGFHPEMTGRENIFMNGSIMGMTKAEIKSRFDQIVDFAGVESYIDTPVKRYSSGMTVRLGFAIAAHLEPEILVVDEVLAVGDAEFQKKALGKMQDVSRGQGRTILFVSHNMAAIENLCNKGMLLLNGTVHSIADTKAVISTYLSLNSYLSQTNRISSKIERKGNGKLKFVHIELIDDETGTKINEIKCGANIRFRLFFERTQPVLKNILLAIAINDQYEQRISFLSNEMLHQKIDSLIGDKNYVDILVIKIPINPGRYNLTLFCSIKGEISDWIQNAFYFNICSGDFYSTGKEVQEGNGYFLLNYLYK